jgi:hypothetical protein
MTTMRGWHFLAADRRMQHGDRELVTAGRTYTAVGALRLCHNGLHVSKRVLDALTYGPGPIVCRVRLGGEILSDHDKSVGRTRTVLWMADATEILHEFALVCGHEAHRRAPMRTDLLLCGSQFSLDVARHRLFESSVEIFALRPSCRHASLLITVYGDGTPSWIRAKRRRMGLPPDQTKKKMQDGMGIDWMTRAELCQAIPPAYTEFIGRQMLAALHRSLGQGEEGT